jgi:hypothetical protein
VVPLMLPCWWGVGVEVILNLQYEDTFKSGETFIRRQLAYG